MRFLHRRNRLVLVVLSLSGAAGLVAACGGDDATIAPIPNSDVDSGGVAADGGKQNNGTDGGTMPGKDAGATDGAIADAGRDAQRVTNPDGGCDPVQKGEIYVDPNNGVDTAMTPGGYVGQAYSAACALKTITAALAYVGASPAATRTAATRQRRTGPWRKALARCEWRTDTWGSAARSTPSTSRCARSNRGVYSPDRWPGGAHTRTSQRRSTGP